MKLSTLIGKHSQPVIHVRETPQTSVVFAIFHIARSNFMPYIISAAAIDPDRLISNCICTFMLQILLELSGAWNSNTCIFHGRPAKLANWQPQNTCCFLQMYPVIHCKKSTKLDLSLTMVQNIAKNILLA